MTLKINHGNVAFLHAKREVEFSLVFSQLDLQDCENSSVLELGSGSGHQLTLLSKKFRSASGIDLADSRHRAYRTSEVIVYDGTNIPFEDNQFDYVFSSNTMEHIPHLELISSELSRVLKPGGTAIHTMPTHSWRFWSIVSGFLSIPIKAFKKLTQDGNEARSNSESEDESGTGTELANQSYEKQKSNTRLLQNLLLPKRHGERGNALTEHYYFHPAWWRKYFERNENFQLVNHFSVGLFYTAHALLNTSLSWNLRKKLSIILGSACHVYVLKNE